MSTTRRVILISAAIRDEIHSRLHNAEGVDFRGGGDQTFGEAIRLQLLTSGPGIVDAYGADWRLEDQQWLDLKALIPPDGVTDLVLHSAWRRNSTELDTVLTWYDLPGWTLQGMLDDVTRKPRRLRIVAEV